MSIVNGTRATLKQHLNQARGYAEDYWFEYLMFGPTLLFLVLLLWIPFLNGIWMTFHEWSFLESAKWVGLGNYRYLLGWEPFHTSLVATAIFSLTTVFQVATALVAALVLKHRRYFKNLYNGLFLLPYTLPGVVVGTIWMFLLNPTYGSFQKILIDIGLLNQPVYWQSDGTLAMATIMFATSWKFWPFAFLVIYATLESIPQYHYEAAQVYGANRVQSFFRITLPQLKSAIVIAFSIRFVWNLVKVAIPLQMTGGGPGYETSILAVFLYQFAWESQALGRAYTVGLILFAVSLIFIGIVIRTFLSSETTEVGA